MYIFGDDFALDIPKKFPFAAFYFFYFGCTPSCAHLCSKTIFMIMQQQQKQRQAKSKLQQAKVKTEKRRLEVPRKTASDSPAKRPKVTVQACTTRFGTLSSIVENDELKDVELVLNKNKRVKVHRLVLAAGSKPLCRKLKEVRTGALEIDNLNDVEAFLKVIDFVYGRELEINELNIFSILTTSCLWEVEGLKEKCINFLLKNVSKNNAAEALKVSERLELPKVASRAAKYVAENLAIFMKDSDFFQSLPDTAFKRICERDDLAVPNEAGEFAIIDLIFKRAGSEELRIDSLLKTCVRLVDLTDDQMVLASNDTRFETLTRRKMLYDALLQKKLRVNIDKNKHFRNRTKGSLFLEHRIKRPTRTSFFGLL